MKFLGKSLTGLLLCGLLTTVAGADPPTGIHVLATTDVRTYSEDITYVRNGPYAKHVVFFEGLKVYGYPASQKGNDKVKLLFDLSDIEPTFHPNGLAYMESEKRFAVVSLTFPDKLMVYDSNGRPEADRVIQYPDGYTPSWLEGLAYIPEDSALFPDHLALCSNWTDEVYNSGADIFILRRDGSLAKRIELPGTYPNCGAVAFRPPGQLLVSGLDGDWSRIWTLDFYGNILAGPSDSVLGGFEGLVSLPDGHVLGIGTGGAVRWLGADLVWLPERDRIYRPTEGLGQAPAGVAWDSTKGAFVLSSRPMDTSSIYALYNLPEGFGGVSHLVDLWPRPSAPYYVSRRLTFLSDEDLIATAQPRRRSPGDPQFVPESIQFFSGFDGTYGGQIDLSGLGLGTPQGIAYLSQSGLFAMSFLAYEEPYEAGKVYLFSRDGDWIRAIDYSATITRPVTALTESASENELLITDSYSLFVADLDGNVTQQFSVADIQGFESRVQDLATVTTGKYEAAFVAITYGPPAKLTIFKIRGKGN